MLEEGDFTTPIGFHVSDANAGSVKTTARLDISFNFIVIFKKKFLWRLIIFVLLAGLTEQRQEHGAEGLQSEARRPPAPQQHAGRVHPRA